MIRPVESKCAARTRVGFIVGPTGAGKTVLALEVAQALGAEIINADSRQFYRGMDIGTAKPSQADRARVPHHLIDVRDPGDPLDAAAFSKLARTAIAEIAARSRPPLAVGGSGLYLRVLRGGIFSGPAASREIRERLDAEADAHGTQSLHARLREVDAEAAGRIAPGDRYRIVRALEVFELTGEPISSHQRRHRFSAGDCETLTVGIAPERTKLYEAIDRRFDEMVAAGLVDEVRRLLAAGLRPDAPPLSAIGYKQIAAYVRGECGLEEAIASGKRETRRLAKRQMTWFRAQPEIVWLNPERAGPQALELLSEFFQLRIRGD
ncbi:MAG TPA: tRNA (adenosine(37)-N6)-dimethylallyltransferase MiaA [Candidatus Binataceae bacterium]|nr:tRNA (adenosine(37)-N6)-dimethylallyltransferase MiaA [Candidatus Binataceae bacterium]